MAMSYEAYHDLDMRPGYLLLLSLVVYPTVFAARDHQDDDVPFDPFRPESRLQLEAKFEQMTQPTKKKAKWQPKQSDVVWVQNLMAMLDYGGKWIAPMGFTFIKIDDHNIELRQAEDTPSVRDTVHRTVLTAQKAGLKVKVNIGKTAVEKQGQTLMEIFAGARVPLLDVARRLVGEDLVRRLPADGWTPEELHRVTDGTKYDGVGEFADWVCSQTGCVVLDNNYGDVDWNTDEMDPTFSWSQRNVDMLTRDWPKVKEIRQKIDHIVEWLEADPPMRFRELLDFILPKIKTKYTNGKKAQKGRIGIMPERHAYDDTEHFCPLDQEYNEEEEEDGIEAEILVEDDENQVEITEITPEDFVAGFIPRGQEHQTRRAQPRIAAATVEDIEAATQF
jgi:hypothetical protein